ncbi:MAG: CotS family spore coat protein [Bacillota bacterium]
MDVNLWEISRKFGVKVKKMIPLKTVFLVEGHNGVYCLKKLPYREEKLLFLHGVKEHLEQKGFHRIDKYVLSKTRPYVKERKDIFIMTRWILGRECDFSNPLDIYEAAKTLAAFHLAAEGFTPPEGSRIRSDMGTWVKTYSERCADLMVIKNLVKMKAVKNAADMVYLRNVDMLYQMGVSAVKMLQGNGYFEQVEEESTAGCLCHHDYTDHNIIVDHNGHQHMIDFDYCKYELRCYDLAHFIMRNMKKFFWDFDMAMEILEVYDRIRPVSDRELKLMGSLFQFPQGFWRMSTRYYYEKYDWKEGDILERIEGVVSNIPFQIDFLETYHRVFL